MDNASLLFARRVSRRGRLGWLALATTAVVLLLTAVFGTPLSFAGTKGNALFDHGFSAPNYNIDGSSQQAPCSNPSGAHSSTGALGDTLQGQIGASVFRLHCYWSDYQTGVNQYNQAFLDGIVQRVIDARNSSGNLYMQVLINFDLPTEAIPWMQAAGYELAHTATGGAPRYYPGSKVGQEAYGKAMARVLKNLNSLGMSSFIETPNEPNWSNGIAQAIPAPILGSMGAMAVTYAALEGLQQNTNTGPAILVGSVVTGQTDGGNFSQFYNSQDPKNYFGDVQYWTDIFLQQWWASVPGGPSYATTLSTTWRPSFHAYPKLGPAESAACLPVDGFLLQDQKGDTTGEKAYNTVSERLTNIANIINNNKKWWVTETGMTSFKVNHQSYESYSSCAGRRWSGGSTYGKDEQSKFYGNFVYYTNWRKVCTGFPWSRFEGVTFFLPQDVNADGTPFAGFGVHWPAGFGGCGPAYPCRKKAAYTFEEYY